MGWLASWRHWENALSQHLQRPVARYRWVRWLALLLAHSGDGWFWFPGLLVMAVFFPTIRAWAWLSLRVLVLVAIVVAFLKYTVRRPRPQSPWGGIYRRTDPHAFPSGHAARGAALAWLAWHGLALPWPWVFTLWAVALAWSRAAIGVHHPSDVVAGAVLGLLLAWLGGMWF